MKKFSTRWETFSTVGILEILSQTWQFPVASGIDLDFINYLETAKIGNRRREKWNFLGAFQDAEEF